ncbi:hypothetical protein ACE6H2_020674 [Prunus campanulata]
MEINFSTVDQLAIQMEDSLGLHDFSNGVTLFGSLLADKPPNIGVVKRMLTSAWIAFGEVQIVNVKDLIFAIKVQHEEGTKRIVDGGPQKVMGFAFTIQYWLLHLAIEELDPNLISFWVQGHGVPFGQMNGNTIDLIGHHFGKLIAFENLDHTGCS